MSLDTGMSRGQSFGSAVPDLPVLYPTGCQRFVGDLKCSRGNARLSQKFGTLRVRRRSNAGTKDLFQVVIQESSRAPDNRLWALPPSVANRPRTLCGCRRAPCGSPFPSFLTFGTPTLVAATALSMSPKKHPVTKPALRHRIPTYAGPDDNGLTTIGASQQQRQVCHSSKRQRRASH